MFIYKDQNSLMPLEVIYLKGMQIRTNVKESMADIPNFQSCISSFFDHINKQ